MRMKLENNIPTGTLYNIFYNNNINCDAMVYNKRHVRFKLASVTTIRTYTRHV
jgi:hypothetical protein